MKISSFSVALLALTSVSAARAQDIITTAGTDWRGFFVGANIGGAWNHTCQSWTPGPGITGNPALATAFYNRDCPNNGNFIGGVDLGYNFQYDQWVWGFKADYDAVGNKSNTRSYTYTATSATDPIPSGTYSTSGKFSPNGIGLLGPRIGYSFGEFLPFLRAGAAFAGGQHTGTLSFTPVGGSSPTNSISGGKNFKSTGWNVGVGFDYGISGPWSFTSEYNYVNLGKGTNSTFNCSTASGTVPPICATYANFSLDNIHNSFTMNMFRVGFHYRFGGRSAPEAPLAAAPPPPPAPPAAAPLPPPPAPAPCHAPPGFKVDANCHIIEQSVIVRAVDFEFNLSQLTAPAQQTLDEVASALLTQPELHVEIQGHTDSVGSAAYNLNLSQRRAEAVKDYLISKGVSGSNLTAKGYGKDRPIVSNDTAEGRAQNRRVAFEVTNVPAHVNVVNKDASAASTEAAQQGEQAKPKKKENP